jgi:hypothetical protein
MDAVGDRVLAMVSGLPRGERERRRLMVLQAFVDDSGNDPQDEYLVLAGFVASVLEWIKFSDAWQAELDKSPKLKYFKMTEAHSLRGQFDRNLGWTESERDKRVRKFARIAAQYAHLRISTAIRHEHFEKYIKGLAVPERKLSSDSPYFLLFTHLIRHSPDSRAVWP